MLSKSRSVLLLSVASEGLDKSVDTVVNSLYLCRVNVSSLRIALVLVELHHKTCYKLSAAFHLSGVTVKSLDGQERMLECHGLFVSIGRTPVVSFLDEELQKDGAGYLVADETTCTNLPGVFAAGDVRTKALRQVVTAASDGAVAAHFAEEYLAKTAPEVNDSP